MRFPFGLRALDASETFRSLGPLLGDCFIVSLLYRSTALHLQRYNLTGDPLHPSTPHPTPLQRPPGEPNNWRRDDCGDQHRSVNHEPQPMRPSPNNDYYSREAASNYFCLYWNAGASVCEHLHCLWFFRPRTCANCPNRSPPANSLSLRSTAPWFWGSFPFPFHTPLKPPVQL